MRSTVSPVAGFMVRALVCGLSVSSVCSCRDAPGKNDAALTANRVPESLPRATAPCPEFHEGLTGFSPNGVQRKVQLYLDDAASKKHDGPLIFYWYGTTGQPSQVIDVLGVDGINRIKALGGIVVAAAHRHSKLLPWINVSAEQEFALMDDVLACAIQKVGVDLQRIHAMGFSTGALLAARAGYARSGYLASLVIYSGGASSVTSRDPNNRFPVMIIHGGANDRLLLNFQASSLQYAHKLVTTGHNIVLCNHASGHKLPLDAAPAALRFLLDHPFRQLPEPYLRGLPGDFPAYCTLQPGQ